MKRIYTPLDIDKYYSLVKNFTPEQQERLSKTRDTIIQEQNKLKSYIDEYNILINEHNDVIKEIERLNKS